jgi:mRNA interferase RelE/StbE
VTVPFELRYHHDVKSVDIPLLDGRFKARIKTAIETRLGTAPHQYGEALRKTLHGYWKLRVGDYRVVYKILGDTVLILAIIHRKKVYEAVGRRLPTTEKDTDNSLAKLQDWVDEQYGGKKPRGVVDKLIRERRRRVAR